MTTKGNLEMAKVSPLLGRTKFDWRLRLGTLVAEVGNWALAQGEEGTKRVAGSFMRGGYRFIYTSKIYGRNRTHATCITVHGRGKSYILVSKNNELSSVDCIQSGDAIVDYKAMYKFLERRIYATFSISTSSDIMSGADSLYDALEGK